MSNSSSNDKGTDPGLLVTITGIGDLAVHADRRATVRDLIAALGGNDSSVLVVRRSGRSLMPSAAIRFSDLRCGDTLDLETLAEAETVEVRIGNALLKALTGTRAGEEIPLVTGENRVGRAADNDVVLLDPGVSRYHATITIAESVMSITDAGSTNGVLVGDQVITEPTPLDSGDRILIGQSWFEVGYERSAIDDRRWDPGDSEYRPILVTPGTRPYKPYGGEVITFPAAPSHGRLWRRSSSDGYEAAVNLFDRSLQTATGALVKEIDTEWSARLGEAPAVAEIAEAVSHDRSRLWPRAIADPLITRVGLASLPSRITCVVPPDGDEELRVRAQAVVDQHRNVDGVPVTVDFTNAHSVLVAGDEKRSRELAYALLGQLAAQHSPDRIRIWALVAPDRVDEWDWLKWLPHCATFTDDGHFHQITADPEHYEAVVSRLLAAVNRASAVGGVSLTANGSDHETTDLDRTGSADGDRSSMPALSEILLIDGRAVIPNKLQSIIDSMAVQADVRVTAFVVGACDTKHQVELPFGHRGSILIVDHDYASLEVVGGPSFDAVLGINYEVFDLDEVRRLAMVMSSAVTDLRPTAMFWSANGYESVATATSRPDLDSLIRGADPAILVEQWADRNAPGRLMATLGANDSGPVRIDLRELGPHALVSGDLEGFMPAWICSLATNYGPGDLNFYLIDSTGGSVFRACRDLPHAIGSLYDTSLLKIKPALAMLSAEMDRREAVLSSLECDSIESLERQGRTSPFPYLVVAVDRVEQLGAQASRSDDEVVSLDPTSELLTLSDRGQQLGVHLILGSSGNERLVDRIPLRLHASRDGSSTLTVGQAPSVSFAATLASPPPEIVIKSFGLDGMRELGRTPLPVVDHDDLGRLVTLIGNAQEFSGAPLPSSLS